MVPRASLDAVPLLRMETQFFVHPGSDCAPLSPNADCVAWKQGKSSERAAKDSRYSSEGTKKNGGKRPLDY
jgi:hypothetical protein